MTGKKTNIIKRIPSYGWVLIGIALLLLLISNKQYFLTLFVFSGIYVIITSGFDLLFGNSGQISLGHAAFFAFGAYTSAILSTRTALPPALTILIGTVFAALFGFVVAIPASKLVHMFLALLTMAFDTMVYTFIKQTTAVTNGTGGIRKIPDLNLFGITFDTNVKFAVLMYLVCLLMLLIKYRIVHSATGRAFQAIRENVIAADGIGINVPKYKVMAFMISAAYTGFAGGLYAHFVGFISPETFTSAQSQLFLVMLLFGGAGNLYGPIIGAVIISLINESLAGFSNYRMLIYGVVVLVAVLYMPRGLYGIFENIVRLIKNSRKKIKPMEDVNGNA